MFSDNWGVTTRSCSHYQLYKTFVFGFRFFTFGASCWSVSATTSTDANCWSSCLKTPPFLPRGLIQDIHIRAEQRQRKESSAHTDTFPSTEPFEIWVEIFPHGPLLTCNFVCTKSSALIWKELQNSNYSKKIVHFQLLVIVTVGVGQFVDFLQTSQKAPQWCACPVWKSVS